MLIQISFNSSSPIPCPSLTPLYPHLPPSPYLPPPMHPFPPSTHHLPPQGWNTGKLTGEERVKEKGWAAFCFPRVCACVCGCVYVCAFVCVLGLNTLFAVCVRLCVRRGGEAIGGADGQLLCSLLYCVHIYSLSIFLSLSSTGRSSSVFPSQSFLHPCLPPYPLFSTTLFFFLSLFPLSLSVVLWQMAAWGSSSTTSSSNRAEAKV